MNIKSAKKTIAKFPILEIKNFLTKRESQIIINELSDNKKFDVHDIHNRKMLVKGSKHFNKFISNSSFSSKLYRTMNSKEFFFKVINLFKKKYDKKLFRIENDLSLFSKKLYTKHLQKKLSRSKSRDKIYFDIDFSIAGKNYYRGPHRDKPNRFFVFLIYLNNINKKSGGCLEILQPKKEPFEKIKLNNKDFFKKIITPSVGKMVVFLANKNSFHAASKFKATREKRFFIYGSYSLNKNVKWRTN
jgi:hypothetical protein